MSNITITSAFTSIADAIRAKTGKSDTMTPAEMPTEIASISGGGGSDGIIKRNIRSGARVGSSLSLTANVYESEV